jgi:hypothetical protein
VADGAYAKAPFLKPAMALGMTVVSRLRKDAALYTVPGPSASGRAGRPRIYGKDRITLAEHAVQRRGWKTGVFDLYGKPARKRYKTFVATWKPAGGAIRVVLVDEPGGWVAFFCTDIKASVAEILATVADRFALETPSGIARRSWGRANSRYDSCGRTSVHCTSASGHSR